MRNQQKPLRCTALYHEWLPHKLAAPVATYRALTQQSTFPIADRVLYWLRSLELHQEYEGMNLM